MLGCPASVPMLRAAHIAGAFVLRKYPKSPRKILSKFPCCWQLSTGSLAEQAGLVAPHQSANPDGGVHCCLLLSLAHQAHFRVILALFIPNNTSTLLRSHWLPSKALLIWRKTDRCPKLHMVLCKPSAGPRNPRALHSSALLHQDGLPSATASHWVSKGSPQTGDSSKQAATNTQS